MRAFKKSKYLLYIEFTLFTRIISNEKENFEKQTYFQCVLKYKPFLLSCKKYFRNDFNAINITNSKNKSHHFALDVAV